jgi:hypothetical protein
MFEIDFASEAQDGPKALRKFERVEVFAAIEFQLTHEPTTETRNRKRLRPNEIAEWELRAGKLRVLDNVCEAERVVRIEAVGFKIGNVLFVRGRSTRL